MIWIIDSIYIYRWEEFSLCVKMRGVFLFILNGVEEFYTDCVFSSSFSFLRTWAFSLLLGGISCLYSIQSRLFHISSSQLGQ